jgi:hypothetical protein
MNNAQTDGRQRLETLVAVLKGFKKKQCIPRMLKVRDWRYDAAYGFRKFT